MKKRIFVIVTIIITFSFVSCNKAESENTIQNNVVDNKEKGVEGKQKDYIDETVDRFFELCEKETLSDDEKLLLKSYADIINEELPEMREQINTLLNLSLYGTIDYAPDTRSEENSEVKDIEVTEQLDLLEDFENEPYFTDNGSGDNVITDLEIEDYSVLSITNNDEGHFAVKAHTKDNYDLLVNTTEVYEGKVLIIEKGIYDIEINSGGNWDISAKEIGTSSLDSFNGKGDFVTPVFISTSDVYEITGGESGYFAVKGYYGNGDYDLLVNTTDPYSGKVMFKHYGEYVFFTISASGEWSVNPVK